MSKFHTAIAAAIGIVSAMLPTFAGSIHNYVASHPTAGAIFALLAAASTTIAAAGPGAGQDAGK